jgi:hypothetical protein
MTSVEGFEPEMNKAAVCLGYTPDDRYFIGESPTLKRLLHCVGESAGSTEFQ